MLFFKKHQFLPGFEEPLSIPAACFRKYETGGVVVSNVQLLSAYQRQRKLFLSSTAKYRALQYLPQSPIKGLTTLFQIVLRACLIGVSPLSIRRRIKCKKE